MRYTTVGYSLNEIHALDANVSHVLLYKSVPHYIAVIFIIVILLDLYLKQKLTIKSNRNLFMIVI